MDIPKEKDYPPYAIQCDECGGHGCRVCNDKGWLTSGHPRGRTCQREVCHNTIKPEQVAVYCSNECAMQDA
jgi:hypothetical protein